MAITKLSNIGTPQGGGAAHLKNCISYILNSDKTEGLVGGNAGTTPQEVYQVMMDTKQEWEKENGRQGYHFVISFPPGEATKEEAYAVINDFCEEYLGENFDYVFSVHTDQKHMHGHIVFNSVNRMDGYKYRYEKGDWEKYIQPITDRVCEKYGLPPLVYDPHNKIGKSYAAHYAEKEGRPSSEKIIKADIDFVIAASEDWNDFVKQMESLGYKIRQGKYVTYIPPGFERGRRDSRLGTGYRKEEIQERIQNKGKEKGAESILSSKLSKKYEREIFQYTETLTIFQIKKIKIFYQAGHYSEMQKQISELHDKAGKVFQETEELRITLNATLQQTLDIQKNALMEQRESYQNSLAAKEELIKERDEKIQSLVNEIEQNKKTWQTEKKTLLLQLEEKKSSDDDKEEQKEVPSKKENSVRDVTEKKKRWHFFNKEEKKSKEPDRFIETYLAGDTFNEAQKEFLIKCLEEGDTVEEMKTYASASLTPAMMQRLRQVRKKRRGQ